MKGKLNELSCQHRFWRWIAIHAPAVVEDLFARYDADRWTDDQWLEHWKLVGDASGPPTSVYPAANNNTGSFHERRDKQQRDSRDG
jgi:hypothetical protein